MKSCLNHRRWSPFFAKAVVIASILWLPLAQATSCKLAFSGSVRSNKVSNVVFQKFELLQNQLLKARDEIKANDPNALQNILDQDIRGTSFAIQAILRLYAKHSEFKDTFKKSDRKIIESALEDIKELEGQIGAYSLSKEILAAVKDKENVDPEFIGFLEKNIIKSEENLVEFLKDEKWLSKKSKKIETLVEELDSVNWLNKKDDQKYLINALTEYLTTTQQKIDKKLKPLILANRYRFEELEYGVHEWRRNLRWIPITLMALTQKFAYEAIPSELSASEKLLVDKYKDSKYTKLGRRQAESILLPPIALYQISKLISDLGKAKDGGEAAHYLTEKYIEFKKSRGQHLSAASAENTIHKYLEIKLNQELEKTVHQIFAEYESTQPLQQIINVLETQ